MSIRSINSHDIETTDELAKAYDGKMDYYILHTCY